MAPAVHLSQRRRRVGALYAAAKMFAVFRTALRSGTESERLLSSRASNAITPAPTKTQAEAQSVTFDASPPPSGY